LIRIFDQKQNGNCENSCRFLQIRNLSFVQKAEKQKVVKKVVTKRPFLLLYHM